MLRSRRMSVPRRSSRECRQRIVEQYVLARGRTGLVPLWSDEGECCSSKLEDLIFSKKRSTLSLDADRIALKIFKVFVTDKKRNQVVTVHGSCFGQLDGLSILQGRNSSLHLWFLFSRSLENSSRTRKKLTDHRLTIHRSLLRTQQLSCPHGSNAGQKPKSTECTEVTRRGRNRQRSWVGRWRITPTHSE